MFNVAGCSSILIVVLLQETQTQTNRGAAIFQVVNSVLTIIDFCCCCHRRQSRQLSRYFTPLPSLFPPPMTCIMFVVVAVDGERQAQQGVTFFDELQKQQMRVYFFANFSLILLYVGGQCGRVCMLVRSCLPFLASIENENNAH